MGDGVDLVENNLLLREITNRVAKVELRRNAVEEIFNTFTKFDDKVRDVARDVCVYCSNAPGKISVIHGDDGADVREGLNSIKKDTPGSAGGHLVIACISDANIFELFFLFGSVRGHVVSFDVREAFRLTDNEQSALSLDGEVCRKKGEEDAEVGVAIAFKPLGCEGS